MLIEVVNAKMRPGIFERHLHVPRDRGRAEPDLCVGKLETATGTRQRNVEGLATKLVDLRPAPASHDTGYLYSGGPQFQIRFEMNRQEQCLANFRTCGREYGEQIAQWFACPAGDDSFKRDPLRFIRTLVDDDLAPAVSVLDFTRPLVQPRPVQACDRRLIEVALNDVADEGRLTIAVGARQ